MGAPDRMVSMFVLTVARAFLGFGNRRPHFCLALPIEFFHGWAWSWTICVRHFWPFHLIWLAVAPIVTKWLLGREGGFRAVILVYSMAVYSSRGWNISIAGAHGTDASPAHSS